MREIQVAENKTLKLTNVLARKIDASELGNLGVILTQMQNFIKSHSAMPVGPVIQCVKFTSGPNPEPQIYFMMQVNQLIPRLEPGYEQDAVLRVKGLPVRPLHRPHGPQQPCQPEAEHLCLRARDRADRHHLQHLRQSGQRKRCHGRFYGDEVI